VDHLIVLNKRYPSFDFMVPYQISSRVCKQIQHEGFKGFFKGMTSPLVGNAWTNAIMFASYEKTLRIIDPDAQKPKLSSVFVAGI
jgi:hypothetical protein